MNITVTFALSPSPSRKRTVPSPYLEWRTRWPFFRLAAPVGSGRSIAGRARAPGFKTPALPPKKRAMLSIESGGASGASALLLFGVDPELGGAGRAVIHEAMK